MEAALISTAQARLTVNNSTIANNSNGGGIHNQNVITVNNSTIVKMQTRKQTDFVGPLGFDEVSFGGILNEGMLNLTNSIVCSNTASYQSEISETTARSIATLANNLVAANALLAPLGNYGGPTMTMPPVPGSPAITWSDAAASQFTTDQRGFARKAGAHVDIGAVESGNAIPGYTYRTVVNTNADFVPNGLETNIVSLRSAVAFATNNATITFATNLSGRTILLTSASGEILLKKTSPLTVRLWPAAYALMAITPAGCLKWPTPRTWF